MTVDLAAAAYLYTGENPGVPGNRIEAAIT